jgi:hypothetical protein
MAMPAKQVSDAGLFVFKEQYEHLKFLKRQTWTITNYVVLIYAAIFSAEHLTTNAHLPTGQVIFLKAAAIIAAVFGLWHLIAIECSMLQTRKQINKSINWIFGPYNANAENERAKIAGPDDEGSFRRDLPFLLALVTVLIVGVFIAVY